MTNLSFPDSGIGEDVARMRSAAGELERYAEAVHVEPSADARARIMARIAAEPSPAPLTVLSVAARRRRPRAGLAALLDLWRVAWSGGRPLAIRLTAALVVVLLLAGVGSAGGAVAVGAWNVLQPAAPVASPVPSQHLAPAVAPSATAAPPTAPRASAPAAVGPMPTLRPTSRPSPTTTPRPTPRPTAPPRTAPTGPAPTHHPEPTQMPWWTHHPEPSHYAEPSHGPMDW